ncbi:MAG: MarR family transcriptional regulator [Candidatus Aminicenantes bacterium]|nr:MarR family transcriptional regulator [Candidatus Aminicenantes bacterium]
MSFYKNAGELIFGTRLKRISDRFLTDVSSVYKKMGIPFEVSWFPLFYLLHHQSSLSVTEIAKELQITHSAVSQLVTHLEKKNLVEFINDEHDKRKRIIGFTDRGREIMHQIEPVWKALKETMQSFLKQKQNSSRLMQALDETEETLKNENLCENVLKNIKKYQEGSHETY